MRTTHMLPLAVLLAASPTAMPAAAAEATPSQLSARDGSWLAWHGCWRITAEDAPEGRILCVLPGADAAETRFVTVADGVIEGTTTLRVDGVARPVEEGGCTGTETARWSQDGRRIFLRAELMCQGVRRISTGALAMLAETEWVDVQTYAVGEQHAVRILRYRAVADADIPAEFAQAFDRATGLARETARLYAAAPLRVDDVIEAGSYISTPALQALLAAHGHGFRIDARTLASLHDAGVDESIIDVMIALSYPSRFAVRSPEGDRIDSTYRQRGYALEDECYDPLMRRYFYGDACYYGRGFGYSRYGYYGYGYGYSPWGYDRYGWRSGTGTVVVIVRPDGETPPARGGAVVKGAGYTSGGSSGSSGRGTAQPRAPGNPNHPAASVSRPASSGSATARPGTGSGSSTPAAAPASTGSGSSSGSSTGRTAVPRNSGGGGEQ
jgi:hypothetical protein